MASSYSEDKLVEQPAISLFGEMHWDALDCYNETYGEDGTLGREHRGEVILKSKLLPALQLLNPDAPAEALDQAVDELARDRSAMSMVAANQEVYRLLRDGFLAQVQTGESGEAEDYTIRFIEWDDPDKNDFFLASQLWVTGEVYTRRADLIGFVNGIPLVFIELKAAHKNLKNAYDDNLTDYKTAIPQLFWYNAFTVLSNGSQTRVGTITSAWEHFAEWKKINDEGETGVVSLETVLRGTCEQQRLLDIVENFILYQDIQGGTIKIIARYHQYLGVNQSIRAVQNIKNNKGRLGVFWHTQGSGKSFSMVFFSQKVLRKQPGNWTFVVVTDRLELDGQIYKNFAATGCITEKEARAESAGDLQNLLREDHRYVFSLIQKFRVDKGTTYPMLSDRSDVIVMTDEAHRSQYDVFALNMRNALPNAAFIGFTGTPLMAGEEKTREVFGDYVSIYNFRQAIEDNATVPLYYENRIPELQLINENLDEDLQHILEAAELDPDQEEKLQREFAKDYHLITRDDRLEKVAADIVEHFMGRGFAGKAMVVSIDKVTAVRMYDKVQQYWAQYKQRLVDEKHTADSVRAEELRHQIEYMTNTEMAVVVSQSQNEQQAFEKLGLDILSHRKRLRDGVEIPGGGRVPVDVAFKDPEHPFRIVFVCAMWMTGFDAPSCSTLYLDKPMKNHSLMQTIARANRVFPDKNNGLIVDYIGIFRNLEKALAIYGAGADGGEEGNQPIEFKQKLVEALAKAVDETRTLCSGQGIDLDAIQQAAAEGFTRLALIEEAVEKLLGSTAIKDQFRAQVAQVNRLYKAILPDKAANVYVGDRMLLVVLAEALRQTTGEGGGGGDEVLNFVRQQVKALLDDSIVSEGYAIPAPIGSDDHLIDLAQIDFDELEKRIKAGKLRTETERLKNLLERKARQLAQLNKSRLDFLERLQELIEAYNLGAHTTEELFKKLVDFARELSEEEQRGIREGLTEEELAIFDILTKPDMTLTSKQEKQVKQAAKGLLETLKREKLGLDWRKRAQTRAQVLLVIEDILDRELPEVYDEKKYQEKCEYVYQHVYDSYRDAQSSIYATVM